MRIFLINLERDKDRLFFSIEQSKKYGYKIERIPGVYGKDLSLEERNRSVNSFRFWCAVGRRPLLGEIGCGLSHIKIYKKMVEENILCACILEDDIIILDGFKRKLSEIEEWIDVDKPQVVRLNLSAEGLESGDYVARRSHVDTSACSYCLTLCAAKALLKENYPMVTPSDWWPRWDKYGIIELYNCNTKVCWHNNAESGFTSVISQSESKKTENMVSLWRKLYHKVMRLIGIVIDNVLMFFEKSLKLKWL